MVMFFLLVGKRVDGILILSHSHSSQSDLQGPTELAQITAPASSRAVRSLGYYMCCEYARYGPCRPWHLLLPLLGALFARGPYGFSLPSI